MDYWKIVRNVLLMLAIVAAVAACVALWEHKRESIKEEGRVEGRAEVKQKWDADTIEREKQYAQNLNDALAKERASNQKAMEAEREARRNADKAADAARLSLRATGGLRDTIGALDAAARALGVPSAAACPGEFASQRDAAIRARAALSACAGAYRELAEEFDAVELKFDTAMKYIGIVAPKAGAQ